jgi:hypothetical protein
LSFQRIHLIVGLVSVLIGVIGFFNYVCHFFAFLVQLILKFFVEIVEDDSFFSETINHKFKLFVGCDSLVKLLVGFVEPVL